MTLLNAHDNFVQRTLVFVPGKWGKLQYIARLRDETGRYLHWGLARMYGEPVAAQAIEEAHRDVILQVLRTPVRDLLSDAQESAAALKTPVLSFLQELSLKGAVLLPGRVGGASARHFNLVLEALAALARAGKGASHRVSSQCQRLGQ